MSIDYQRYHAALIYHLGKSCYKDQASQDDIVEFIEERLTEFLKSNFIEDLESIYSLTKTEFFNEVIKKIALNDSLREEDERLGGMLIRALKIYIAFLGSKWHPSRANIKLGKGEKKASSNVKPQDVNPKPVIAKKIKLVEGAILQERDREIHKRNPKLRELCIKHYGYEYRCLICEMNFVERYGEIGKEFIEVHHLNPISETDGEHEVNPATDLIPLCSNCHSMIHRLEDPSDWQLLKTYLADQNVTNE